jgi:phosphatidylserine decarboxylase
MPCTGKLQAMRYIPGKLFSVNADAVNCIPGLFTRNERVVCFFETERGPMAVIFIGALFVGSICTAWQGVVTPPRPREVCNWEYPQTTYQRGDELGYFNMGSAVIVLFADPDMQWSETMQAGTAVRMGKKIAE